MKKTFYLLSILSRILFALLLTFDLLLFARLSGEFAVRGMEGVKSWILHAGSVGRITSESSGPGILTVQFPPAGPIYREFFMMCGVLLVLTPLSFWAGRFFRRRARQAG